MDMARTCEDQVLLGPRSDRLMRLLWKFRGRSDLLPAFAVE
jgi:hypothetical protein